MEITIGLMYLVGFLAGSSVLQHTVKCLPTRLLLLYEHPAAAARNTSHDDDQQLTALVRLLVILGYYFI